MSNFGNPIIAEAVTGVELDDSQLAAMAEFYEANRLERDGPVRTGLYGEDLLAAAKNAGTVMLRYEVETDEASVDAAADTVHAPVLVPTAQMEWYNIPFLEEKFGPETPLYCYVHPPVPENDASRQIVAETVQNALDEGAVVLFEQYRGDPVLDEREWEVLPAGEQNTAIATRGGSVYEIDGMTSGGKDKRSDIFIGALNVNGVEVVQEGPSIYEGYELGIASGAIEVNRDNGAVIEAEMSDEDAQRIWEIYEKPFERLSRDNAVLAGFDEEHLKSILKDPGFVKVVNRVDGEITTVAMFTTDFEQCPWFNTEYYKREYPEYFETGNIVMCPSIVSDDERRGAAYSWNLIKLMTQALSQRGTKALITCECTEISTKYIPEKVVMRGVAKSGVAVMEDGFKDPAAVMEYQAVRKLEPVAA